MNGEYTEKMHVLSCGEFPARQKNSTRRAFKKLFDVILSDINMLVN